MSSSPSPSTCSVPVWVVGAGGLLGSALQRALGAEAFQFAGPFTWQHSAVLAAELRAALGTFAERVARAPGRRWAIAWCAGLAVVGMDAQRLEAETSTLRTFLELLELEQGLDLASGMLLLASSAGGVYGASLAAPITETTPPEPSSAYGREKLSQELLLSTWAARHGTQCFIARVANVYGPGQRLEKQQGLISHISRCSIYDVPVSLYVSLDTIRDYLYADDWGRRAVAALQRLASQPPAAQQVTKLFASEREVSIATLFEIFRGFVSRPLRVAFTPNATAEQQPARLQFRSRVWVPEAIEQLPLEDGIRRVYDHQCELFALGRLPPPPKAP
ncbi:MAG: NAD-dependent epimerase/dehydratase family protein [Polyangiaceae bacterium]